MPSLDYLAASIAVTPKARQLMNSPSSYDFVRGVILHGDYREGLNKLVLPGVPVSDFRDFLGENAVSLGDDLKESIDNLVDDDLLVIQRWLLRDLENSPGYE